MLPASPPSTAPSHLSGGAGSCAAAGASGAEAPGLSHSADGSCASRAETTDSALQPGSTPWSAPACPATEDARLQALHAYAVLDTPPEAGFDDLVCLAQLLCEVPIALVSLVDARRQWFKARVGLGVSQTDRTVSFCGHAIHDPAELFVVEDTLADPRFAGNPLVVGEPRIRFYAGAPMVSPQGHAVGTLCVIDQRPRVLGEHQREGLLALARQGVAQLELRRALMLATQDSLTDTMTGIANQRAFEVALRRHWARLAGSGEPLAVLLLDIDGLRAIDATFGPAAADALLRDVAARLQAALPQAQPLARWGLDGFAALLPGCNAPAAVRLAETLRRSAGVAGGGGRPVALSIGIASAIPEPGTDAQLAVHRAGMALQVARARGGGRVELAVEPPAPCRVTAAA